MLNLMKKVKEGDNKWSQLPTLVIWMIKDRLFIFIDVFHLSLVCKDWKVASECYPFKSQSQFLAPWIMLRLCNSIIPNTQCEFVNVSTNEKLIIDLPVLRKAELLYSKQGWLLFRERFQGRTIERPVTLLHLYTNTEIIMSDPGDCVRGYVACFSSSADGNPEFVVFDASRGTCKTLFVAFIGDNNWIKHSNETGRRMSGHTSLVVLENKIYCIDQLGSLCIFDMSNLVWTEVMATEVIVNPVGNYGYRCSHRYSWITETGKGEIVKIQEVGGKGSFKFSKLNENTTGWEVLNNSDMEGMRWFISKRRNNQFTVREPGKMKKVYSACLDSEKRNQISFMIDIYDLFDGSIKSYRPDKDIHWVDLGTVFKIPPSCVGYERPSDIAKDIF